MSEAKYAVINGVNQNIIGILYENEKQGKVLVTNDVKINMHCDIEIMNVFTGKIVNSIDLKSLILEAIPHEENNDKSL